MNLLSIINLWLDIIYHVIMKCATVPKLKSFHQLNTPIVSHQTLILIYRSFTSLLGFIFLFSILGLFFMSRQLYHKSIIQCSFFAKLFFLFFDGFLPPCLSAVFFLLLSSPSEYFSMNFFHRTLLNMWWGHPNRTCCSKCQEFTIQHKKYKSNPSLWWTNYA